MVSDLLKWWFTEITHQFIMSLPEQSSSGISTKCKFEMKQKM